MSLKDYLSKKGYHSVKLKKTITNHFSLRAKINGVSGRFILDTGASNTCIAMDAAPHFKLQAEDSEIKAAGAGASDMITRQVPEARIKIGAWHLDNLHLMLLDLSHVNTALTEHHAPAVDGIIGADILESARAVIDYNKKRLYLKKKIFRFL